MTPEQIEAAAQAIRNAFANRVVNSATGRRAAKAWETLPERIKDEYRSEAKAALEAAGL